MDNCGDVVSLQDLCLLTVGNYLSPSNVWSIYRLVPYVHCKRIEHIVHSFICDNFMDISHTHQFLALDEKEMQWLVDNDEIVASEAAVFDGLARWYKHSEHQRENAFKQLFDRLHVSVIGRNVLWQVIKKYELYKVIPDLRKYKVSAKFLPRRLDLDELIHDENIFNIMVFDFYRSICNVWSDDTYHFASFWVPFAVNPNHPGDFKDPHNRHKYVILKQQAHEYKLKHVIPFRDKFFVLGMMKRKGESDFVPVNIRLDFHLQTVTHCQAPLINVLDVSGYLTVTCGIYIFFLGGFGYLEKKKRNTVYRYDTVKDEWREMSRMIHCRTKSLGSVGDSTAVAYKNRYLYVFGTQYNEKYDIYTNTWTPVVFPSVYLGLMCKISAFGMNDKIYRFIDGPYEFQYGLLVFDPLGESWQKYDVEDLSQNEPLCDLSKCFPQECCGEYFSTFDDKIRNGKPVWHLSAVDESLREIKNKKLYSAKARNMLGWFKPDIKILNRRARVRLVDLFNAQTQDVILVL